MDMTLDTHRHHLMDLPGVDPAHGLRTPCASTLVRSMDTASEDERCQKMHNAQSCRLHLTSEGNVFDVAAVMLSYPEDPVDV